MFRLAHATDLHIRNFSGARLRDFFGKRIVGTLNLALIRRKKHRMELVAALGEDLRRRDYDHLVVTGDLGNVSLMSEWAEARAWIERTSPVEKTTVIPGNHDTYVAEAVASGGFEKTFAAYQTAALRRDNETYPFVRLLGEVALVGLSTCVPTGDFGAWGRVGAAQLRRLESLLMTPEVRERFSVLIMHHPPIVQRPPENRNLQDRAALTEILSRVGVDLILHGHDHRDEFAELPGPEGRRIPVVGTGSASYSGSPARCSRYNIYEIQDRAVEIITYAHDPAGKGYVEFRRKRLG
jgi:3',5'-cyclic AMP phosphodiesterase CpdA